VQETEAGRFLLDARQQFQRPPFKGPVCLRVTFDMPRPKGHFGSGRRADILKPSAPHHHTKKPDLDNLAKFVKDVLNGLAWEDDCQVVNLYAVKRYAGDCGACTLIHIEEVEP
jgi:Holliday junction resolvase RusA-like endonuclease